MVGHGETCHCPTWGLSLADWLLVLIGCKGDKKPKFQGVLSYQARNLRLFWIWLGVGRYGQGESYSISLPSTSPETPSPGSPVVPKIHLPGNELACFMSPPSHPFSYSLPLLLILLQCLWVYPAQLFYPILQLTDSRATTYPPPPLHIHLPSTGDN